MALGKIKRVNCLGRIYTVIMTRNQLCGEGFQVKLKCKKIFDGRVIIIFSLIPVRLVQAGYHVMLIPIESK